MQTYWFPVCLQLQRIVRHSGRTTTGSPLTMNLFEVFLVIASKYSAQFLLATLGDPQLMTWTSSKMLEFLTSMKEMVERPPPKLIPVMQIFLKLVCCLISLRSLRTSVVMVSHMLLQAFWILQLLQTLVSTTWLAQRMSCQTLSKVLVYLKARTMKVGYTLRTHFTSFAFSQMQWLWSGLFSGEQTLQSQLMRSCLSSLPTIIELARSICSTQGSAAERERRKRQATTTFMFKKLIIIHDNQSTQVTLCRLAFCFRFIPNYRKSTALFVFRRFFTYFEAKCEFLMFQNLLGDCKIQKRVDSVLQRTHEAVRSCLKSALYALLIPFNMFI